jgi:mono/diheme cytochrome c family protein
MKSASGNIALVTSLLLVGCGASDDGGAAPEGDCGAAAQHVESCFGPEVASAFAENCSAKSAADALADDCGAMEEGKSDSLSTKILSPPVEQFKYGSIGTDKLGLPVALHRAMPLVCSDLLPPGTDPRNQPLTAFGFIYEDDHDLPIGFSTRRVPLVGIELAGITCSVCHTSTVRENASSARELFFGAPNIRLDVELYNEFVFGCISDPTRFNASNLLDAFDELGVYGLERFLAFQGRFIDAYISNLRHQVESVVQDGPWGPGRDDAIGLAAAILMGEEFVPTLPAPVDFPSAWNLKAREGNALHWDGGSGSAEDRNLLVSVAVGAPRDGVPISSIAAIQSWLDDLPPPAYPYALDQALVTAGKPIFEQLCNDCHGSSGTRLWSVIDLAEIGTDPNRVEIVTQEGVDMINDLSGWGWSLSTFQKTNGYLSSLLDGVWLRAPYLHNGSVPTLRDLLKPAAERPQTFYRGNDTYDASNVGFVWNIPSEGSQSYTLIDTTRSGSHNAGHEGPAYGTELSEADKDALLEYLKTL